MLRKYQEVTAFEISIERRLAFSKRSAQDRSDIMRTHLILQIAERTLNKEQIGFIAEIIPYASSELYATEIGTQAWAEKDALLRSIKDRILNYFPKKEAFEILASLNGKEGAPPNTENIIPNCNCSNESNYCSWWYNNSESCDGVSCKKYIYCGTFFRYLCTGMCEGTYNQSRSQ